ncbi:hypothetical protein [Neobacillus dielmonensis]|uniref:hypothetical protein n=1 Tax=Neobacillus dielmonensis TaxID=1347369 RepID=UPI0005A9F8FC|nr:hypothetical protein [Neobacillus dielmonensis]
MAALIDAMGAVFLYDAFVKEFLGKQPSFFKKGPAPLPALSNHLPAKFTILPALFWGLPAIFHLLPTDSPGLPAHPLLIA